MSDVHADHDPAIVTDPGDHAATRGARVDCHVLADGGVLADLERRGFAGIFEVLRPVPDRGERVDLAVRADRGTARHYHVRQQFDLVAELGVGAHEAIWPDLDALAQGRAIFDDGRRVNIVGHYSPSTITMAPTSASAMRVVPTIARASYQPMALRRRIFLMWYSMTSPGLAGFLNLHLSTVTM